MKERSVLILAGGESSRMGKSKAFLKYDASKTFLEKIVEEYLLANIEKIILVINKSTLTYENKQILTQFDKKHTLIYNENPEKGRLYSLRLGLRFLNDYKSCFIQNIDNPFVNTKLINNMIPLIKNDSWVSPTYNSKGGHPVLISNSICKTILENDNDSDTLRSILRKFHKIKMLSNKTVLTNINTEEDYCQYFSKNSTY